MSFTKQHFVVKFIFDDIPRRCLKHHVTSRALFMRRFQLPVYWSDQLHNCGSCIQMTVFSKWTQLDANDNKG